MPLFSFKSEKTFFTLDELNQWETIRGTLEPPARLAVIGDPVAHSLSPQMHNPALAERGIAAQYIRVQVPVGRVKEAFDLFQRHEFIGVNCTIPHKFEALAAVDEIDPLAQKLGAVNTVRIEGEKLIGYNSDGPGFLRAVEEVFGQSVQGLKILIAGAGGGAGQAVAKQCALAGCGALFLANRTVEKVQELAATLKLAGLENVHAVSSSAAELDDYVVAADLIVNASSLGLKAGDAEVLPHALLEKRHWVFDMVYRKGGTTPLVAAARKAGAKACDGLPLLLYQGAVSFAHWFGEPVPLEAMRGGLEATGKT
jgi:shikimate dehydrogenase